MGKKVIMWDSVNNLVWVKGQKRAGSEKSTKFYGKDARSFDGKGIRTQRKYAYALAKKQGGVIYDKYYGKYIQPKNKVVKKTPRKVQRSSNPFNFNIRPLRF